VHLKFSEKLLFFFFLHNSYTRKNKELDRFYRTCNLKLHIIFIPTQTALRIRLSRFEFPLQQKFSGV